MPKSSRKPARSARRSPDAASGPVAEPTALAWRPGAELDEFVARVSRAAPLDLVLTEREGVHASLLKDLSNRMAVPASRLFAILGVPKATAEKKVAAGDRLAGQGGQALLGMIRLLGMAREMAAQSTSGAAADLDPAKWLGRWIETPQPALGGRRPADLLDTPTGAAIVARLLGSIESGAYS